jgi:signal peptidase I
MSSLEVIFKKTLHFISTIFVAILIATFIKEFFMEFQLVPTGSMIPYILEGDRLLVSRLSFGLQNPLFNAKKKRTIMLLAKNPLYKKDIPFSTNQYIYKRDYSLSRYDIVVFFPPEEPIVGRKYLFEDNNNLVTYFDSPSLIGEKYVKRILGLGGETLEIKKGHVYINGEKLEEDFPVRRNPIEDFGPMLIPENSFFVIGDNRMFSSDSRHWGPVPEENLLGKPLFIFWPLNRVRKVENYGESNT